MTKEQVIYSLEELPNEFDSERLIERIIALDKMQEELEQVKRGELVTVEEVRQRLAKWLH